MSMVASVADLARVIYESSDAYLEEGVEFDDNHASPRAEAERQAGAVAAYLGSLPH